MAKKGKKKWTPVDLVTQDMLQTFYDAATAKKQYDPLRATLLDAWKRKVPIEDGVRTLHISPKKDRPSTSYEAVISTIKARYPEIKDDVEAIVKSCTQSSEQAWIQVRLKALPIKDVLPPGGK